MSSNLNESNISFFNEHAGNENVSSIRIYLCLTNKPMFGDKHSAGNLIHLYYEYGAKTTLH